MDPAPDFRAFSTEQLLEPVGVPLLTLIQAYDALMDVALDRPADRTEALRLATALLAVITAVHDAATAG